MKYFWQENELMSCLRAQNPNKPKEMQDRAWMYVQIFFSPYIEGYS